MAHRCNIMLAIWPLFCNCTT